MNEMNSLNRLCALLKAGTKVTFLNGAGISCACGIPDFRSPGGMYDTLRPELLTATQEQKRFMSQDPTAVVSYELFRENPFPYLEVRRPFILGISDSKWKPSLSHYFMKLVYDKGLLQRIYTQNIDGLDFQVGVPDEKLVAVHGSIATICCEACGKVESMTSFKYKVQKQIKDIYGIDKKAPKTSTHVKCEGCGKAQVKPSTVLYGRNLPARFFALQGKDCEETELMFIIGTSLTVYPAAAMPDYLPPKTPIVVVNRERVGDFAYDTQPNMNIHLGGSCDDALLQLIESLGWTEDLRDYLPHMCEASQQLVEGLRRKKQKITTADS